MQFVRVGAIGDNLEQVVQGHVWVNQLRSLTASWKAIDGQSGIKAYHVALGSSPGNDITFKYLS